MRLPESRKTSRAPHLTAFALTAALGLLTCPSDASGQERRADLIAAEQAQKARDTTAAQPTRAERIVTRISDTFLQPRDGFYPYLGSVYGGGGFTPGAGYLRYYGDRSTFDIHGLYSFRNYKLVEATTRSPGHAGGRLELGARVGWRDATRVGYYGLGIESDEDDRANYRFKETYVGGTASVRPARWITVGGGITYEDYRLETGQGSDPSIETRYTPDTAPGLGASPAFVHTELTGGIDWRTSPGYSRTGGYYGLALHDYADPDDAFSFSRLDATVIQHIPILKETWVLSVRGRLQTTLGDNDVVPYFLLPSLGGGSVLRGYHTGRFRDRHALVTTAEWRWFPNRTAFDVALFFDAGTVASQRSELWSQRMATNWGIGARFHGPAETPVRAEVAHGADGWKLVFGSHAAF